MAEITSASDVEVKEYNGYEDTNSVNSKRNLENNSKVEQSDQLFDSDTEEDSFESLALNIFPKDYNSMSKISKESTRGFKKDQHHCRTQSVKLRRSFSAQSHLNETNTCNNCFINELHGSNSKTFLGLQEELSTTIEKLKDKSKECNRLIEENKALHRLLESGEQKPFFNWTWNFSPERKSTTNNNLELTKNFDIIQFRTEIRTLNQKISNYEMQLQEKDNEIWKLLEKIKQSKQNFSKKTEVQKEIFEEMDLKLKTTEEKLNIEKKLRQKREAEISHIHSYLSKREHYYQNQIDDKAAHIRQIEINHNQGLKTTRKIIKQKDEELLQITANYNLILDKCNQQVEAININFHNEPLEEMFMLEKLKASNLDQTVQLKTKLLDEAYLEINILQNELHSKQQELINNISKLSVRKDQTVVRQQLENIKEQINELLNGLVHEPVYTGSGIVSKHLGDKEEVC